MRSVRRNCVFDQYSESDSAVGHGHRCNPDEKFWPLKSSSLPETQTACAANHGGNTKRWLPVGLYTELFSGEKLPISSFGGEDACCCGAVSIFRTLSLLATK
ncbi:hypothetical protein BaRGS_00000573 [Batillaria attramentaria]|uniref:Uncharacterized protein n=1 Tax=Batillaria attramentaria TaxID=370345 RepID=A0ABD0M934_9CAEN